MVYMYNCLLKLCRFLKCSRYTLRDALKNPDTRRRAYKFLERYDLFFMPTKYQIAFDSLTYGPANELLVYRGRKNIDVEQFMFVRYYVDLKQPELPCIVELRGHRPYYYPLESVGLYPRRDNHFEEGDSDDDSDYTILV